MIFKLKTIILIIFFIFCSTNLISKEIWILDKDLSIINFEIPIFIAPNAKGKFNEIDGLVEIDDEKENNKAIFSVKINSIEINYDKYKDLILSEIFFFEKKFPIALLNTKKFSYNKQKKLDIFVELNIKGFTQKVPLELKIIPLADELIQIKGKLNFSRTAFQLGIGKWSNTTILKDTVQITTNLFFFKN